MNNTREGAGGAQMEAGGARQWLRAIRTCGDPREQRRLVEDYIAVAMREIVDNGYTINAKWTGTTTDLIELCHVAWMSVEFASERSGGMSFSAMAKDVCRKLHCNPVQNPFSLLGRMQERKEVESVVDRYTELMVHGHIANPVALELWFL